MLTEAQQKKTFGRSIEVMEQGWKQAEELNPKPALVLMSMLSDVQELLDRGYTNLANQQINMVKYFLSNKF